MRFTIVSIFLLFLSSCDKEGYYEFIVNNVSSENIQLKFYYESERDNEKYKQTVQISEGGEKTIRIITAPLNSNVHDCFNEHGISYFKEIIFDTFADSIKIEKQLWQPENWVYKKRDKWAAEYKLIITEEMLGI